MLPFKPKLMSLKPRQALEMQVNLWFTGCKILIPFIQNVNLGPSALVGSRKNSLSCTVQAPGVT